jgi:cleavage and polyadenylation specificity factor subunit 1
MPDVQLGGHLPTRTVPRSRPYSNVIYEPATSLIVAASTSQARFASFDEDGNRYWEPDGTYLCSFLDNSSSFFFVLPIASNVSFPTCECSALELISPDSWITMDGYGGHTVFFFWFYPFNLQL